MFLKEWRWRRWFRKKLREESPDSLVGVPKTFWIRESERLRAVAPSLSEAQLEAVIFRKAQATLEPGCAMWFLEDDFGVDYGVDMNTQEWWDG